jgi:hypothetical protein
MHLCLQHRLHLSFYVICPHFESAESFSDGRAVVSKSDGLGIWSSRFTKRGGGNKVTLAEASALACQPELDLLALDEALETLSHLDPRQGRIVELRFFGGLTEDEIAEVVGASVRTVKRNWHPARAMLYGELSSRPRVGR